MLKYFAAPLLLVLSLSACQTLSQAQKPEGLMKYGFTHVLKTINFKPGHAVTATVPDAYFMGKPYGYATISIPADAFTMPVKFQILTGSNSYWDKYVASNLKVVANFAYLVTDVSTGAVVTKFNKPAMYSVKDSMITKDSIYWAVTASRPPKIINANGATKINGMGLMHPTSVSSVGWIITTPKSEISMKKM
jgi:hypothetical protein